ncbi:MAG: hypothetical protein SPF04_06560 [Bacilli bacterium]|nr:hypothetical protein [Bacilli bacterium]
MANYIVDNKKKIITVDMGRITDKQLKQAKKFIALGYELKVLEKEKPKPKYTKKNIEAFLEEKGTEEERKIFKDKQKEIKEETGNEKGFINGLQWFKAKKEKEFEDWLSK